MAFPLPLKKTIKVPNIAYYEQMLNTMSINNVNKKYYQDLIASIKKQNSFATANQLHTLLQLKRGNIRINESKNPQKTSIGKTVISWDWDENTNEVIVIYDHQGDDEFQEEEVFYIDNAKEVEIDDYDPDERTTYGIMRAPNKEGNKMAVFNMRGKSGSPKDPDFWRIIDLQDIISLKKYKFV